MSEADEFKAFEAAGWSAQAPTYGDLSGAITSRFSESLLDAAGVRHGDRVLDVATGPGYVAERAAARGARPVGMDIAEGMLAEARRRHPALEFVAGDAEQMPFEDASFHSVVGGFVLNHLPRPERALREAARVLTTAGTVAFSEWDRDERMELMAVLGEAFDAVGLDGGSELPPGPDPDRFTDPAELRALLEQTGFAEIAVENVAVVHTVGSADEVWHGFLGGTVRGATMARAQPTEVQERLRRAVGRALERHRGEEGYALSIAAHIASGRKPAAA
jgi:SAM-dependent methyltransferase